MTPLRSILQSMIAGPAPKPDRDGGFPVPRSAGAAAPPAPSRPAPSRPASPGPAPPTPGPRAPPTRAWLERELADLERIGGALRSRGRHDATDRSLYRSAMNARVGLHLRLADLDPNPDTKQAQRERAAALDGADDEVLAVAHVFCASRGDPPDAVERHLRRAIELAGTTRTRMAAELGLGRLSALDPAEQAAHCHQALKLGVRSGLERGVSVSQMMGHAHMHLARLGEDVPVEHYRAAAENPLMIDGARERAVAELAAAVAEREACTFAQGRPDPRVTNWLALRAAKGGDPGPRADASPPNRVEAALESAMAVARDPGRANAAYAPVLAEEYALWRGNPAPLAMAWLQLGSAQKTAEGNRRWLREAAAIARDPRVDRRLFAEALLDLGASYAGAAAPPNGRDAARALKVYRSACSLHASAEQDARAHLALGRLEQTPAAKLRHFARAIGLSRDAGRQSEAFVETAKLTADPGERNRDMARALALATDPNGRAGVRIAWADMTRTPEDRIAHLKLALAGASGDRRREVRFRLAEAGDGAAPAAGGTFGARAQELDGTGQADHYAEAMESSDRTIAHRSGLGLYRIEPGTPRGIRAIHLAHLAAATEPERGAVRRAIAPRRSGRVDERRDLEEAEAPGNLLPPFGPVGLREGSRERYETDRTARATR